MPDLSSKGTGALVVETLDDIFTLLRKEMELLRAGLVDEISDKLKGAGLFAAAAIALLPALVFLLVAIALWLPGSAAFGFFLMSVMCFVLAGAGVWFGVYKFKSKKRDGRVALDRVKEDARWARERLTR